MSEIADIFKMDEICFVFTKKKKVNFLFIVSFKGKT